MTKIFLIVLISLAPIYSFAQHSLWSNDTASKRIMQNDCNDKIFTKVEQIASLNISKKDFEDTLNSFLKPKKAFRDNEKIEFKFIVTTHSQIFDITKEDGDIRKEDVAKEAILKFSSFWNPAIQNGRSVCSYVRLEMNFEDKLLHVTVTQ
jgi:hypothetical protein